MQMNKKRSFIIDFGCCLPFGHNLQVVNLYKSKEESRGQLTKAIICKEVKGLKNVNKEQYDFILPSVYFNLVIDTIENKYLRFGLKLLKVFSQLSIGSSNLLNIKTQISVNKLFKKYNFNNSDLIIFPSTDYYGAKAFLKKLVKIKKENRPRVHLRYIGVLEDVHCYYKDNFSELIELMNLMPETLTVSAEVPVYSRYINTLLPNINVVSEPYPILDNKFVSNQRQKKISKAFAIVFPGTNRADKGYLDLFYLAKELLFEFPSVRLIVQDMKKWDKDYNQKYRNKLKDVANVNLVDAILSREEMENLYQQADLILLPYCPNTYHYRGSGVHYEAIELRIPVLVRKGVGFEEEVVKWSSGWLYETKQELFQCLKEIIDSNTDYIKDKMENAFLKLKKNSDEAYNSHLS